jgi:hypothetical protein
MYLNQELLHTIDCFILYQKRFRPPNGFSPKKFSQIAEIPHQQDLKRVS